MRLLLLSYSTPKFLRALNQFLKDTSLVGPLGLASIVPMLIGLFFIAPLIKKYGKRNMSIVGIAVVIIGSLAMIIDSDNLTIILTGTVIKAIGMAPMVGTLFALLADTVDYREWKTGIRTEGLVYSAGSFGAKAGSGLGAALIGWLLAWGGYVGGQALQSANVLASIQFMFIYFPIIIAIVNWLFCGSISWTISIRKSSKT